MKAFSGVNNSYSGVAFVIARAAVYGCIFGRQSASSLYKHEAELRLWHIRKWAALQ